MKEVAIVFRLLIIMIALFQINSRENDIQFIYDFCINGTISIINLGNIEGNFIYYYYDFNSFCFPNGKQSNYYFLIEADIDLINENNLLNYVLLEKKMNSYEEIKHFEVKDLNYTQINYLKKEKGGMHSFSYYYKIKIDPKINTGIFRISKNGNKKGNLWMSSLEEFSDNDINEK